MQVPDIRLVGKVVGIASQGYDHRGWYQENYDWFTGLFGKDEGTLWLRILGATSQRNTLQSNVTLAVKAMKRWKEQGTILEVSVPDIVRHDTGEVLAYTTPSNYLPALESQLTKTLNNQHITGRKIRNFVDALTGNRDAVVIDMWMAKAWQLEPREYKGLEYYEVKDRQYDYCEEGTRMVARFFGVDARDVQAMVWTAMRGAEYTDRRIRHIQTYKEQFLGLIRHNLIYQPYTGTNYFIGGDGLVYIA
jgi:hypothetical protein